MNQEIPLQRINYYNGQFLSASDLIDEQDYFLARLRRQNRYNHGWGVISGLEVVMSTSTQICIAPGIAIDCMGNEVVVCAQVKLKIPKKFSQYFVALKYVELMSDPIPNSSPAANAASDPQEFSRIKESYLAELVIDNPPFGHRNKGPGTPGCGVLHPLCIARLKKSLRGWTIELKGRRRTR